MNHHAIDIVPSRKCWTENEMPETNDRTEKLH